MNDGMPWRRLERLEPCDQKLLSFAARSLRDHLLRYPDDAAGILLSRSQDPVGDLILVLGVRPKERATVRKAILELIEDGFLERSDTSIRIKNFSQYQGFKTQNDNSKPQQGDNTASKREREAKRKADQRARKRAETRTSAQESVEDVPDDVQPVSQGHVPDVPNGTCPTGTRDIKKSKEEERRSTSEDAGQDMSQGHGTRDTGHGQDSQDQKVPCPMDLNLTEDQRGALETSMIPGWAIDEITKSFVAAAVADQGDKRQLVHWRKCLGKAVASSWNDKRRRPRKPEPEQTIGSNGRPVLSAKEAGLPEFLR